MSQYNNSIFYAKQKQIARQKRISDMLGGAPVLSPSFNEIQLIERIDRLGRKSKELAEDSARSWKIVKETESLARQRHDAACDMYLELEDQLKKCEDLCGITDRELYNACIKLQDERVKYKETRTEIGLIREEENQAKTDLFMAKLERRYIDSYIRSMSY